MVADWKDVDHDILRQSFAIHMCSFISSNSREWRVSAISTNSTWVRRTDNEVGNFNFGFN